MSIVYALQLGKLIGRIRLALKEEADLATNEFHDSNLALEGKLLVTKSTDK